MGKPYASELDAIHSTFEWAYSQNVAPLSLYLKRWIGEYACFVGSGGSYSAAYAVAELREISHHSPSRALTPMELSAKARFTPGTKVFLLSAEGRNSDILAAATYAMRSDMTCSALTLTSDNPLTRYALQHGAPRVFSHDMPWGKDGYLATNSLIATVLILRRAIFGDRDNNSFLELLFMEANLRFYRETWSHNSILSSMGGRNFIVLHDPMTKSFAIELESKLAESAVAKVEIADYRQFAHGRHLQLAAETDSIAVIAAYSQEAEPLAAATIALIPATVLVFPLQIPGKAPEDLIVAGVVMATLLTEAIANVAGKDPGQPKVPKFGRDIYSLNSEAYYQGPLFFENRYRLAAHRKLDNLHASEEEVEVVISAARAYESKLESATYKAIISDFDGTLCNAEQRYIGMCSATARRIIELMEDGIVFCIASGRGGSLRDVLVAAFPAEYHSAIWVGYYGGSLVQPLSAQVEHPTPNQEFNRLINWLKTTIHRPRITNFSELVRGGQLTIKVASPEESRRLRLAIRAWLNAEGLASWRVFCSGHSIDILDDSTTKNNVVSFLEGKFCINGQTQILRLGDSGDEEGNDYELLGEGLSLSADRVSTSLASCWNYASAGSSQAQATKQYLDRFSKAIDGFQLNFNPVHEEGA